MPSRIFHTLMFAIIGTTILFMFSGCGGLIGYGNILHGPSQEIQIFSEPDGATAEIDGDLQVMTPNVVTLKRKSSHYIKTEKDGYEPFLLQVNKTISVSMLIDLISIPAFYYPLIGMISDFSVGGGYNLSPKFVNVKLQKKKGAIEEPGTREISTKYPILPVEEDIKPGKHPEVIVKTKSKRGFIGKLWELQDNSILIQPLSWKEEPALIDLNAISQVELRRKVYSRAGYINGAIIGFLANTFITTPILSLALSTDDSIEDSGWTTIIFIVGGVIGTWIGVELGGTLGFSADLSSNVYTPKIDFSTLSEQQKVMKIEMLLH